MEMDQLKKKLDDVKRNQLGFNEMIREEHDKHMSYKLSQVEVFGMFREDLNEQMVQQQAANKEIAHLVHLNKEKQLKLMLDVKKVNQEFAGLADKIQYL